MLSSAASADHRPGIVARSANDDRVAEPLRPLLVGGEHVPDEIDRRAVLRRGGAEIAAHEISGRGRRSERDLSLARPPSRLWSKRAVRFGGRALDGNDRHRRAGHAGVRTTHELLAPFHAGRHVARRFRRSRKPQRRQQRHDARRKRLARPSRTARDWQPTPEISRLRRVPPEISLTKRLTRTRSASPIPAARSSPRVCDACAPVFPSPAAGLDRRHDRRAEKLSSGRGAPRPKRGPRRRSSGSSRRTPPRSTSASTRRRPSPPAWRAEPRRSRSSARTPRRAPASTA